ncbi:hypothetical protein PHYBOEH_002166 [Phytophthora boehmeriae]|uniref:Uncharacterized protein n=1 Tax=Phytophthora boehmeriae TaxID=109152 RepID=A0A8T1WXF0_9STRA|nr:hypothetical protein PHYBOEH_002166 [Phytophthora boehmeriae]
MDGGGRGGGRGKGKKGKAARQKKAAAAAASQKKAVNAHHGGKKAGAAHSNVQVVAVLKSNAASPAAAHGDHNATAALKPSGPAPHEHSQPKPKRKKAKAKASGAANMLLKKQAVSEAAKQAPAAPTPTKSKPMQETAQAKSPTTRNVAGTSPKVMTPTAADTATTAKPHIVSLTGGKRKRKRRAASHDAASTSESTAHVATVAPPKTEVQAVGEKAQQIKMQAGVVNIPVTSPPAAVPAKTEALTATTPKRKIAKTAILNSTPPEDETQKTKGGVAISAPSSKNDEFPNPLETGGNDAPTQESRSPGAHALSTVNQQEPAKVSTEPVDDKKKESVHTPTRPGNLGTLAGAADTKTATEHHSISKVGAGKTATAVKVQPPAHTKSAASIASKLGFTPQDTAAKVEMGDAVYAVLDNSSSRNQSSCKGKMEHVASSINDTHPRAGASDAPVKTEPVGIIMDSRAYVENMMSEISEADGKDSESTDLNAVLPTRPQNSWGASFGLVPPAQSAPRPARTLSTTPLSSWFLSKGPANFVQQVHFSDDDDDGDDHSHSVIGKNLSGALPKKGKQSSGKKNAFLESLTTQSSWRSWYGNVNLQNLLDPPLAHVPDSLLRYKESPPALPAADNAVEGNLASGEKKSALESLEEDIRREKQRGSEFGEQLLQMLQGKTVSGKLLEEEFSQIVH